MLSEKIIHKLKAKFLKSSKRCKDPESSHDNYSKINNNYYDAVKYCLMYLCLMVNVFMLND